MTSNSFIIPNSPFTRDLVYSCWEVSRHNEQVLHETIIPKGLVEIIFSFETVPALVSINRLTGVIPRCFVQGYNTTPMHINHGTAHNLFGVVLSPSAIKHLFNYHPSEFTDCMVDLSLVDANFRSLWNHLGEQNSFDDRVNAFTKWLVQKNVCLSRREKAFDAFLKSHSGIHLSVDDLANQFCYSTKQLSRKVHELTGMNTERTLLYKRYLRSVNLIHTTNLSLTEIAYQCHFYDQSHFAKTFKSLSQLTAKEYRRKKAAIEGHIFDVVS